jgi:hypothetical protein
LKGLPKERRSDGHGVVQGFQCGGSFRPASHGHAVSREIAAEMIAGGAGALNVCAAHSYVNAGVVAGGAEAWCAGDGAPRAGAPVGSLPGGEIGSTWGGRCCGGVGLPESLRESGGRGRNRWANPACRNRWANPACRNRWANPAYRNRWANPAYFPKMASRVCARFERWSRIRSSRIRCIESVMSSGLRMICGVMNTSSVDMVSCWVVFLNK